MNIQRSLFIMYLLLHISIKGNCPLEKNVWYFGTNAGVDFSTGSPLALTNGQIAATEGGAVASDSTGTMLFYTDGINVWNAAHQPMPNGNWLNGGNGSSSQSALIIRKPGSSNLYYIFTADVQNNGSCSCLAYSVVDMNLQSGMGNVTTTKNVSILAASTERVAAVKDASGNGIWVVAHEWGNDAFHAFHVTSAGINTTPVISNVGNYHMGVYPYYEKIGALKFSDDGAYLVCTMTYVNVFQLFDFDNNTGIVSNTRSVPFFRCYGAEFSPSNQFLYVASGGGPNPVFKQYDISSGIQSTIVSSAVNLTSGSAIYGMILRGPDNKLYMPRIGYTHLCQINLPDQPGIQCNYADSAIYLGSLSSKLGLPNFMSGYHTHPNPKDVSETEKNKVAVKLYPNPSNDLCYVSISDPGLKIKTIDIYNTIGELVYNSAPDSPLEAIDASRLPAGIYHCHIRLDSGLFLSEKLIRIN